MAGKKNTKVTTIELSGHQARALRLLSSETAQAADMLQLPKFQSLIWLIGSAGNLEENDQKRLQKLIPSGLWQAAIASESLVVDGGTDAGIMSLAGAARHAAIEQVPLLGVAPADLVRLKPEDTGKTALEPHHSHFLLTDGDSWGDETRTVLELIALLSGRQGVYRPYTWKKRGRRVYRPRIPCIAVLAGGGEVTRKEVYGALKMGLKALVIGGSGGLADELTAVKDLPADQAAPDNLADIMSVAGNSLIYFDSAGGPIALKELLRHALSEEHSLQDVWESFAKYDKNANQQQKKHFMMQGLVLIAAITSTLAVLLWKIDQPAAGKAGSGLTNALNKIVLLLPVVSTLLLAIIGRFKYGQKWLLLRSGAESIKREIFIYRVARFYHPAEAQKKLLKQYGAILEKITATEVNRISLDPYDLTEGLPPGMFGSSGEDDGFSALDPEQYIEFRLEDQLNYYQNKVIIINRRMNLLILASYIITAAGTALAVFKLQLWIALTTSLVSAITTWLSLKQWEATIVKYNQTAVSLEGILQNWRQLQPDEQLQPAKIDELINATETAVQNEFNGWIQQMMSALEQMEKQKQEVARNK